MEAAARKAAARRSLRVQDSVLPVHSPAPLEPGPGGRLLKTPPAPPAGGVASSGTCPGSPDDWASEGRRRGRPFTPRGARTQVPAGGCKCARLLRRLLLPSAGSQMCRSLGLKVLTERARLLGAGWWVHRAAVWDLQSQLTESLTTKHCLCFVFWHSPLITNYNMLDTLCHLLT